MPKKSKPLKNGEAMQEFYSSIKIIAEHYNDKGYKKQTLLYQHLKDMLSWKMSFESFKYHYRKHIINDCFIVNPKINNQQDLTPKKETVSTLDHDQELTSKDIKKEDDEEGPKIARPNFKKGPKFNPHTVDVDKDRLL